MVGKIVALWRYPVKSMAPEPLESVEVGWHGLAGDRRWAFVQDALVRSGFPWLTIRERTEMRAFQPFFADPSRPEMSVTMVRTPEGDELDVVDPALAERLGGGEGVGVRVIKQNRGVFDTAPLSLITTQSVAALGGLVGLVGREELDPQRFRPNLLVEAVSDEPFQEETWVGRELTLGGLRMRVDQKDERCVIVNVDPVTLERDPSVLKTIGRARDACMGVYGAVVSPGSVAVGDAIRLAR